MFKKKSLILILLLPVFLTGCARAQGALAPTGESSPAQQMAPIESNPDQFLPQVEPASLEPIINYVDGLNLALTGEFEYIKASATANCSCLDIAGRIARLLKSATLLGGDYQLTSVKVVSDGLRQKSFAVVVHRGDLRKVDRASKQSVIWSKSEIKNQFIVNFYNWLYLCFFK